MKGLLFIWKFRLKLHAESDKLQAEGNKLRAEGDKLQAEGDKLQAEGNKLRAESDKLWAEGNKLWAEGDKLQAEGDKLQAEGDKLWAEAIIEFRGNIYITWTSKTKCTLETGEVFNEQSNYLFESLLKDYSLPDPNQLCTINIDANEPLDPELISDLNNSSSCHIEKFSWPNNLTIRGTHKELKEIIEKHWRDCETMQKNIKPI